MTPTHKQTTALIIAVAAVVLWFCFKAGCNSPKPTPNLQRKVDSLTSISNIKDYQYGILLADNHKLIETAASNERKYREGKIVYVDRVRTITSQAPDTCKPYIAQVVAVCDSLITKADSALSSEQTAHKSTQIMLENRNERIAVDSALIVAKNEHIDLLKADNKKAEKKAKRAKMLNKVIFITAAAWTGFVAYVTMGR